MKIEEAIKIFEDWAKCNYEPTKQAAQLALTTLRSMPEAGEYHFRDDTKMVPLSLEQLKQMDGKPVWVEFIGHPDGTPIEPLWMLVNCREKRLVTDVEYVDWNSEGWFAYSYPPAHIDRSKWTAEWVPMTDDDGCVWLECSACEYDLDSMEESNPFCPSCGRAMTEEAWTELERRLRG